MSLGGFEHLLGPKQSSFQQVLQIGQLPLLGVQGELLVHSAVTEPLRGCERAERFQIYLGTSQIFTPYFYTYPYSKMESTIYVYIMRGEPCIDWFLVGNSNKYHNRYSRLGCLDFQLALLRWAPRTIWTIWRTIQLAGVALDHGITVLTTLKMDQPFFNPCRYI